MRNNKIGLLAFGLILTVGIIGSFGVMQKPAGDIVEIRQNGEVLYRLDLADYQERTIIEITYNGGSNTVLLESGGICMLNADCPDQTCVKMGWLNSATPIVCLPHRLVIQYAADTKAEKNQTDATAN